MFRKLPSSKLKLLCMGILTVFVLTMTGCPARKPDQPEPPPPETVVVPEVSRIFFTNETLADGPLLARQLVDSNQGGEMTVWFEFEEEFWVLVQAAEDSDELLAIDEVLQRMPGRDTMLIEVRLEETPREQGEVEEEAQEQDQAREQDQAEEEADATDGDGQQVNPGAEDAVLIRLDLNQRPHGIAFMFDSILEEELEEPNPQALQDSEAREAAPGPRQEQRQQQQTQQQAPQQQQQPAQQQQNGQQETFIQVQEPQPNGDVGSPLQVVGRARVAGGTIHLELKDDQDQVIAESSTTATAAAPQIGNFSASLSFSTPEEETQGTLEVYSNGQNGRENVVAVPVVIK